MLKTSVAFNLFGRSICRTANIAFQRTMENKENQSIDVDMVTVKKRKLSDMGDVQESSVRFTKMNENAQSPIYGSAGAVGADICSAENCVIPAKGKYLVHTGLKMAVPQGYYARIAPRSGLALKHFIDVGAGVVDPDYRGEVNVLLFNFNDIDFEVKVGDRVAQVVFEKCDRLPLVECDTLDETTRGEGGFGSTGVGNEIPQVEAQMTAAK